ncbi:MAG: hypothetical protein ACJ8C4_05170 [Gemmataceae bacterium]
MEEILVLIIQIIFEVAFESMFFIPFDLQTSRHEKTGEPYGCLWYFMMALVGGGLGGLSSFFVPHFVLHSSAMRAANFFLAPLFAAGVAFAFSSWRKGGGAKTHPPIHAISAFCFVLAFAAVRLIAAER